MTLDFIGPQDWDNIMLAALDADGALYSQRSLRLRMAREMQLHAVSKLNF
jgi:hypothetical protein